MSFSRSAGWIVVRSVHATNCHDGDNISHYFNAGQTRPLCGNAGPSLNPPTDVFDPNQPVCKRCVKYLKISKLLKKKRIRKKILTKHFGIA